MAAYFFDSSAVVKFHIAETGTAWVRTILLATRPDGTLANPIFIANITEVEVTAAVSRRARAGGSSLTNPIGINLRTSPVFTPLKWGAMLTNSSYAVGLW